jgi:hypothetical protein
MPCAGRDQGGAQRRRIRPKPAVNNSDLIDRARRAHGKAGWGMVVLLHGVTEPRYVPIVEAKESLAEANAEPDFLASVIYAAGKYDPKWAAILFLGGDEGFTVFIVRLTGAVAVGGIYSSPVN